MKYYESKYTGAEVDALLGKVESGDVGGKVTVDSALSTESENPVQNKVITAALNEKVDKVSGKGLSTNDYTTSEKDKLASLENYNDSEIKSQLTELSEGIGKKADKDGVYSGMTVGRSIDLLGVEDVEEGSFVFRPTDGDGSIKDGVAVVKSVKGESVVWNQYCQSAQSRTHNGVTFTNNGDGSWTINGTAEGGTALVVVSSLLKNKRHKWLITGLEGGSKTTYYAGDGRYILSYNGICDTSQESTNETNISLRVVAGASVENLKVYPRIYDLTQMFGAGNEPTTIEDFNARMAKLGIEDVNAYNAGEVVNMKASGIKSVGFNAWDEEWELGLFDPTSERWILGQLFLKSKNLIPILPNTQYRITNPPATISKYVYYDENKQYVSWVSANSNSVFTTPSQAHYMLFQMGSNYGSTYNHDICINLVHSGYRNGEYEPYVEDVVDLPTLDLFPNGMNKIGDVYDEYDSEKSVQRIGIRPYQSGDESIENVLTDGTSTFYVLEEPIVTPHDYRLAYKAWDFGTEQVIADGNTTAITAGITYEFNARDTIRSNKTRLDVLEPIVAGKIDKVADDYYPQLAVGLADNLSGVDVVDSEVNFRRSGGGAISDGVARIEAIKGNSVVWNQLRGVSNVSRTDSKANVSLILTKDSNIIRLRGIYDGTIGDLNFYIQSDISNAKGIIGHKYMCVPNGLKNAVYTIFGAITSSITYLKDATIVTCVQENTIKIVPRLDDRLSEGTEYNEDISFSCVDLTKMFGAGNEPTTIEEFYQRIPMGVDLNAYNEGEVIHMDVQSIESQGVNAWDGSLFDGYVNDNTGTILRPDLGVNTGFVRVLPNTQYYIRTDATSGRWGAWYDKDKNYISGLGGVGPHKSPSNAEYMRMTIVYNNDGNPDTFGINISDTSINGKYFPYIKRTEDLSIIRKYFPQGMKSAGTAHDEIRYNRASGKWEYSKGKMKEVDMGTLNWNYTPVSDTYPYGFLYAAPTDRAKGNRNILCDKYITQKTGSFNKDSIMFGNAANNLIYVVDSTYTDAASFTAAMSGVMLYYESKDWEWEELDAEDQFKDLDYQVWNCGTEKAIAEGKSAPLAADITYGFNAIGKIKELEKQMATLMTQFASLTSNNA